MSYISAHIYSSLAVSRAEYPNGIADPKVAFDDLYNIIPLNNLRYIPPIGSVQTYVNDPVYDQPYVSPKFNQVQPQEFTFQFNFRPDSWTRARALGMLVNRPARRAFRLLLSNDPQVRLQNTAISGTVMFFEAVPTGWTLAPSVSDVTIGTLTLLVLGLVPPPVSMDAGLYTPLSLFKVGDQGSMFDAEQQDHVYGWQGVPVQSDQHFRRVDSTYQDRYIQMVSGTGAGWFRRNQLHYFGVSGNWRTQLPNSGRSGWMYLGHPNGVTKVAIPTMNGSNYTLPTGQYTVIFLIDRDLTTEEDAQLTGWIAAKSWLFHQGVFNDTGVWNDTTIWP